MSFTHKNLQAKKSSMGFIKWATLFFLWMSAVLFVARAFDVGVIMPNAVQYIQKVFLTSDGSNGGTTGIMLDGTTNGWITITNLPSKPVLGTDANGKITGSSASVVYNLISSLISGAWATWPAGPQWIQWIQGNTWPTGLQWVAWATWPAWPQGIQWIPWVWSWTAWATWATWPQWPQGLQWPQGNTWATWWFSSLNCTAWQIAKYNGTIRECSGDLQWWGWWVDRYTTGMNFNSGNNILTLYVSGANTVTGSITLSGANNWNSAYTRTTTSWNSLWNRSITTGKFLRDRYNNIGIHINTLATATLNCTTWQIAKYNGSTWVCAADAWALPFTADSYGYSYTGNIWIGTNSMSSLYRSSMFSVLWDINMSILGYKYTRESQFYSPTGNEPTCTTFNPFVGQTQTSAPVVYTWQDEWTDICQISSRDNGQDPVDTEYYQKSIELLNTIKNDWQSDIQIWFSNANLWMSKVSIYGSVSVSSFLKLNPMTKAQISALSCSASSDSFGKIALLGSWSSHGTSLCICGDNGGGLYGRHCNSSTSSDLSSM